MNPDVTYFMGEKAESYVFILAGVLAVALGLYFFFWFENLFLERGCHSEDFGLDSFCLQRFWATEASFRFIMVTYKLRYFALNHHNRATLKTLKSYCFALGAWKVNHANKQILKISLSVKKRSWMDGVLSKF